ncbi:MAG: M20/M25/M40 family metallo-hydrolase, partial [bacterium]
MREIIDLTKELIRLKTMHSKPEEIQRCASHIENYLKNNDIPYRRMDHNQIPSIWVMPPNDYASILLISHIDVVDAPDEMFEPVEKDGKLFGRGSIDDKYAVALSLVLVKEYLQRLKRLNQGPEDLPFGILITGDEEIGGANGVQMALKEIKTDFAIALDGGSIEKIVVKEKGIVQLKLIARGKTAHGARPWLGENAIDNLISDYLKLKDFFDLSTPDHWHRTLNFGRIQAGESLNQVPDYA